MYLFIDTETSNFPPRARVLQLAMLLTDEEGNSMAEHCSLIRLDEGVTVSEGAQAVHGFSAELCNKYGISASGAYNLFTGFANLATCIIAHNAKFDMQMMEIEASAAVKPIPAKRIVCTMEAATPICKIPPTEKMLAAGRTHYKAPNLKEALSVLCGRELEGAHHAMVDVKACRDVFFALKAMGEIR